MPKSVNRPRDEIDAEQLQQGPIDFAERAVAEQMGDSESPSDSSQQQSPA